MKKLQKIALSMSLVATCTFAAQIAPSPLVGPEFSEGVHQSRAELTYVNYQNINGYGIQGTKRYALSDRFALTPSLSLFHLSGKQTYSYPVGGEVTIDMDRHNFVSGGLRGEVQHKVALVNFIAFGGVQVHYGKSKDTTSSTKDPTPTTTTSTDKGLGWEAGIQGAMKTGPFTTTLFYKYDVMRLDTKNKNDANGGVASDESQKFTFKSSTVGIDVLFNNGISLSGLYSMVDDKNDEDITMIKLGFSF